MSEVQEIKEYIEELFDSYFVEEEMPAYIDFYEYKKYMLPKIYYDFIEYIEEHAHLIESVYSVGYMDPRYSMTNVVVYNMPQVFQDCVLPTDDRALSDNIIPRKMFELYKVLPKENATF